MYVVRNTFTAKPGHASKLATQIKEAAVEYGLPRCRVLTDLTGDYNRVILEYEAENLGHFEETMKDYSKRGGHHHEKMKGYTEMYVTGTREILQIV